jgi:hypothetical protein
MTLRVVWTCRKGKDVCVVQSREIGYAIEIWISMQSGSGMRTIEKRRFSVPRQLEELEDYLWQKREGFESEGWTLTFHKRPAKAVLKNTVKRRKAV